MRPGKCKLCGAERELCESHIIPEFCFKPVYDQKHRASRVNLPEQPAAVSWIQKGFREPLLCCDCERLFNDNYERPFKDYWDNVRLPSPPAGRIGGFDYTSFKLFHLSILWRAGVCSEKGIKLSLGPYAEKLRAMLFSKDPGPVDHYPILGRIMMMGERIYPAGSIGLAPLKRRHKNCRQYILSYCGVEWFVAVTDHPAPELAREAADYAPRADGSMMLFVGGWLEGPSVRHIIKRLKHRNEKSAERIPNGTTRRGT